MHQKGPAIGNVLAKKHVAPDGEISFGQSGGIDLVNSLGDGEAMARVHGDVFSIASSVCQGDDVIVLTGRGASAGLIAMADTVSTIHCEKHGHKELLFDFEHIEVRDAIRLRRIVAVQETRLGDILITSAEDR